MTLACLCCKVHTAIFNRRKIVMFVSHFIYDRKGMFTYINHRFSKFLKFYKIVADRRFYAGNELKESLTVSSQSFLNSQALKWHMFYRCHNNVKFTTWTALLQYFNNVKHMTNQNTARNQADDCVWHNDLMCVRHNAHRPWYNLYTIYTT